MVGYNSETVRGFKVKFELDLYFVEWTERNLCIVYTNVYIYYEATPLHRGRQPPGCRWRV
jgi:hypothetical protein